MSDKKQEMLNLGTPTFLISSLNIWRKITDLEFYIFKKEIILFLFPVKKKIRLGENIVPPKA
jgi:hypothetical protein